MILLSILLVSCNDFFEREVDIDIPNHESKLVLSSFIYPGDSLQLFVYYSQGVEEKGTVWDNKIIAADIRLLKNGTQEISVLLKYQYEEHLENPYFKALANIEEGDNFTIEIDAESYDPIYSSTQIPNKPIISEARFEGLKNSLDGDLLAAISFDIEDEKEIENYYEVIVEYTEKFEFEEEVHTSSSQSWTNDSNIPWIEKISNITYSQRLFFTDETFKNGKARPEILAEVWPLIMSYPTSGELYGRQYEYTVQLNVRNITKSYYDFVRTFAIHEENQFPDIFSGEPAQLYSNVEGGFGVFGSYAETKIPVQIDE